MSVDLVPQYNSTEDDLLDSMITQLPQELFVKSTRKAVSGLLITLAICITGYAALAVIPWFFWPFAWLLLGFSYTAMFSIGHDCSRGSFSESASVNLVVGNIVSLPLLLPYESWHIQENNVESITAPVRNLWNGLSTSFNTWVEANIAGLPRIWRIGNRKRIVLSLLWVYFAAVIVFGMMINTLGVWGLIKFWLFPWIAYHFWMSTFYSGVFHVPIVGLKVRVSLAFPSKVPSWMNFLTSDINSAISVSKPFITSSLEKLRCNIPNRNLTKAFKLLVDKGVEVEAVNPVEITEDWKNDRKESPTLASNKKVNYFDIHNINFIPALWVLSTPILTVIGLLTVPIQWKTAVFSLVSYVASGLGITIGYHRLYSHRSFSCNYLTRVFILMCGTSAFQGSCIWWARDHRAHHRYVDTDKDPYNSKRGMFWSHMGWLLVKQDKKAVGKTDCKDLESDYMLYFQDKYYLPLSITLAIIIPTVMAGVLWGDWWGGFFYSSIARSTLVLQSTFCINSLAHYAGSFTFSDSHSARDCFWVSFLTFGEGFHNFHHEFPYDYRNGVFWYSWDPSKWSIWLLNQFGFTYDLKKFPQNEIEKGRLQMERKKIDEELSKLSWGPPDDSLPEFTLSDVKRRSKEGSYLLVIDKYVIDVAKFIHDHPGGQAIIKAYIGSDASNAFHGAVYAHSNGAKNLISSFRVGRLVEEKQD